MTIVEVMIIDDVCDDNEVDDTVGAELWLRDEMEDEVGVAITAVLADVDFPDIEAAGELLPLTDVTERIEVDKCPALFPVDITGTTEKLGVIEMVVVVVVILGTPFEVVKTPVGPLALLEHQLSRYRVSSRANNKSANTSPNPNSSTYAQSLNNSRKLHSAAYKRPVALQNDKRSGEFARFIEYRYNVPKRMGSIKQVEREDVNEPEDGMTAEGVADEGEPESPETNEAGDVEDED